ncbi:MAG: hypothetical protein UV63_C0055G0007, partial [Microgenomates group bacterium GW2011_GWC1_43_11]
MMKNKQLKTVEQFLKVEVNKNKPRVRLEG